MMKNLACSLLADILLGANGVVSESATSSAMPGGGGFGLVCRLALVLTKSFMYSELLKSFLTEWVLSGKPGMTS